MGQAEKWCRMDWFGLWKENLRCSGLTCGCCCGARRSFFVCSCKQCEKVAIIGHMNTEVANRLFELQIWAEILKKMQQVVL